MELELSNHLNRKLKPRDIQDIPKTFKLDFAHALKQYFIDYFASVFLIKMITMSFGMGVIRYTPGSKIKALMTFSDPGLVAALFIPTLFAYTFFSLYLDTRTYGMRQTKTAFTFKPFDFTSSLYWSATRTFNLLTLGVFASQMSTWAAEKTGHQMAGEDFLYQNLLQDKAPINLVHLAEINTVSEEEFTVDERIAA